MPDGTWAGQAVTVGRPPPGLFGSLDSGGQVTARPFRRVDGVILVRVSVSAASGVHATTWISAAEWQLLTEGAAGQMPDRPS